MNQTEQKETSIWERIASLRSLLPALLTVGLVLGTLPLTRPVLAELPERLTMEASEDDTKEKVQPSAGAEVETLAAVVDANYEDGVYTGSAQGYGGLVTVQVTVEGGQITAIDILSASGETASFFNRAMGVIDAVLTRQTWEVDVISGATYSSRGILGAIQNALTGEQVENEEPEVETAVGSLASDSFEEPEGGYQDGTYYGSATGFGGTIRVKVVISDGKISSISVVSASGETSSYLKKAKGVINRILKANSPNVDTVSGATYSSNGIINAVKRALAQASSGLTEEPKDDSETQPEQKPGEPAVAYKDGVYTGTGEGFGGDITIQVTITDGKITAVKILSAEDETPAYLSRASTLLSTITVAQSADVDVVSGATYSSNGILEAVRAALAQAVEEEDEPPIQRPEKPSEPVEEDPNDPDTEPDDQPDESQENAAYTDGCYTAAALCTDDDLFCYQVQVGITVADGKIADVTVEKLEDTSDDPETNETYLDYAVNGRTRRGVWYEGVAGQILAKQSADAIDIVSSATYSSNAVVAAAQEALQSAKPDEEKPGEDIPDDGKDEEETPGTEAPENKEPEEEAPDEEMPEEPDDTQDGAFYADGSYSVTTLCTDDDLFCYQVRVTVTVTDGYIISVEVEKLEDTSDDPETNETYLDHALNGRTRRNVWYEGVLDQILEEQTADEIDVVSGATYSSNAVILAAQEALQGAEVETEE